MRTSLDVLTFAVGASILATTWIATGRAAEPETPLPRYRLEVGQELIYQGGSLFKYESGAFDDRSSWHFWVTRTNADGSYRLVIRHGSAFAQIRANLEAKANQAEPENVTFAYCDLFPDGKIVENDSLGFRMRPAQVLPLLPADPEQARKGWVGKDKRMDETTRYRLLAEPSKGDVCQIEAIRESAMNPIYGSSHKDIITFDAKRGLPEKIESASEQNYGFKGKGQGTVKLVEVKSCDAVWCKQLDADAERYFAAKDAYQKATADHEKKAPDLKAALEEAVLRLKVVHKELKSAEFQKAIEADLKQHEQLASYYVQEAENRAKVLNQPAADWSTSDLDGKAHALKDYRGKVLILDFWYRGCGWCVRAMPQMKQIAEHFKGQPVVVFGMNTDRNLEDAKFVVEKMGLNYTNLKAEGLPEKYQVRGFPTLIIIDRDGVVRDLHVGYSPTLKEEVTRSVEKLLK